MARPRAFDDETVLDAAVDCFWQRGLEGTSVRALAEGMGLNPPSLYNAFGDKRQLFMQALERYAATSMRARLAGLAADPSPASALRRFFRETVDRSIADPERRGCLIINTALEVAPHDAEIGQAVAGYFGELERFFRGQIEAARALGEVAPEVCPRDAGRMLLGLLIGVRVLARTGAGRAQLEGMLRPALAMLDPVPAGAKRKGR